MIATHSSSNSKPCVKTIVVIGNGMVGLRFCEKLVEYDTDRQYRIVTFCEEPRAAYDRVGLTSFFAHRDAEKLMLASWIGIRHTAWNCISEIEPRRSTATNAASLRRKES